MFGWEDGHVFGRQDNYLFQPCHLIHTLFCITEFHASSTPLFHSKKKKNKHKAFDLFACHRNCLPLLLSLSLKRSHLFSALVSIQHCRQFQAPDDTGECILKTTVLQASNCPKGVRTLTHTNSLSKHKPIQLQLH